MDVGIYKMRGIYRVEEGMEMAWLRPENGGFVFIEKGIDDRRSDAVRASLWIYARAGFPFEYAAY